MARSAYDILRVSPDAEADEIRSAFRRRIREVHPSGEMPNEEELRLVIEAWQNLKDPARRDAYDTRGMSMDALGLHLDVAPPEGFEVDEDETGVGLALGDTNCISLRIILQENTRGRLRLRVSGYLPCRDCSATGSATREVISCSGCHGTGWSETEIGIPCEHCDGEGSTIESACRFCEGEGRVLSSRTWQLLLPDIAPGEIVPVAYAGAGHAGRRGLPAGDLLVRFERLMRDGGGVGALYHVEKEGEGLDEESLEHCEIDHA